MRSQMEQRNVMVKEQVQKKVTDDKKKIRDVFKDLQQKVLHYIIL